MREGLPLLPFLAQLPPRMVAEYRETFAALNQTFAVSDFCLASTPTIAQFASRLGKPSVVYPNLIPTAFEQLSRVVTPLRPALIRSPFISYMSG